MPVHRSWNFTSSDDTLFVAELHNHFSSLIASLLHIAGIYYTFVMLICAISVSVTMLVLCIYHQAPSHAAVACTPLPRWVCFAAFYLCCQQLTVLKFNYRATKTECLILTSVVRIYKRIKISSKNRINAFWHNLHRWWSWCKK